MAGIWVAVAALVSAGRRGRRSPQPRMLSAALWPLQVRSDGAPWAQQPGGGPRRGGRSGGAPRRPSDARGPGSAVVGAARSLSPGFLAGAAQSGRPSLQLLLRGSWRAQAPAEPAGVFSVLSPRAADSLLAVIYTPFPCTVPVPYLAAS